MYVSMQFPEILFAPAFFLQPRRGRIHLAFPEARWCYTFFRVTGNLSATLERGRWLSVSSGRMYITEGLSGLGSPQDATAAALSIAAEALSGGVRWRVPPLAARGIRGRGSSGARAQRLAAQEQRTLETNGRQKKSSASQLHHPLPTLICL